MKTQMLAAAAAALMLAMAPGALAQAEKVSRILSQQKEIREASEAATGAYSRFEHDEKARLHATQDRIFTLLDGVSDVEQLREDQRVELFNALEQVKAILNANENDRQECWRERKIGTTMRETRCATVAEIRELREGARDFKGEPSICGHQASGISCGQVR